MWDTQRAPSLREGFAKSRALEMGGAGHWQSAIVVVKCFIDYTFGRFLQVMTGTVALFSRKILSLEVSILKGMAFSVWSPGCVQSFELYHGWQADTDLDLFCHWSLHRVVSSGEMADRFESLPTLRCRSGVDCFSYLGIGNALHSSGHILPGTISIYCVVARAAGALALSYPPGCQVSPFGQTMTNPKYEPNQQGHQRHGKTHPHPFMIHDVPH